MYLESAIFEHILTGDRDRAAEKLHDFYPSELSDLAETAEDVISLVYAERRRRESEDG